MILKSMDLSLMAEHLNIHKTVIEKLKLFFCSVENPEMRQVIYEQIVIMDNHVRVMISLMDPQVNENIGVEALTEVKPVPIDCKSPVTQLTQQNIAIEGRHTARSMALDNFTSALSMKAENIKNIHVQMALQQARIQDEYSHIIKEKGWEHVPDASREEQVEAMNAFKKKYSK
ncbi:hypothetical protein J7I93_22495 [Bacillus sp. ISL-47]|uniref:hypothetical protein n=1 Tax=Bacillus sp. ISL-47 TaxID=2819130 RepID=UPI001BE9AA00|nr:hypothetical protein [Bacillus sp. ISL-47]MBT2690912.1 hypothetical protein [Bacillus sp. ISL-47]MBT2710666.1 hypothetical protein [Pseudomonas sp. ISL-84]